ncbi:EscC/YscC/HrcC family type III secretion system outer membrane ring protein [Burkholderia pseudomallei]|nr:EscC/YscC/HrcC family type III secretion system outer membrane ring protein [Burkholderia pseudomallei]
MAAAENPPQTARASAAVLGAIANSSADASPVPLSNAPASADSSAVEGQTASNNRHFVANDVGIQVLLNALSGGLHKPIIASARVRNKHVTGVFDLTQPHALLRELSDRMSLIWYDDGSSVYVYDNSEVKNAVVSMQHATLANVRDFIREAKLYDSRFPLRGDDVSSTFYVTGAPIYVNLVTAAAKYLDQLRGSEQSERPVVKVIQLHNSFVGDRHYTLRDHEVTVPGIATVLGQIFGGMSPATPQTQAGARVSPVLAASKAEAPAVEASGFSLLGSLPSAGASSATQASAAGAANEQGGMPIPAAPGVRAVAYPDTNSLVLVGDLDKVQDMETLVHSLDVAKRQIELSLWIIDLDKGKLDQMGINWQGALGVGPLSVGLNGSASTTLNGQKFLATVRALSQSGEATVVSRPVVLTQENVPAVFDNNQTFYAKLVGQNNSQLEHVTYGTLISVLPRLSSGASQVEMQVDVEDGSANAATASGQSSSDGLPIVNRTEINTVARVPEGKSLLIGGNTLDNVYHSQFRIPGLASIPFLGALFRGHSDRHEKVVRLFLIQPHVLSSEASWQDGQQWQPGDVDDNAVLRSTVQLLKPYMDKS